MATATQTGAPQAIESTKPTISPEQALECDQFIRGFAQQAQYSWHRLGYVGRLIRDNELWKQFPQDYGEEPFTGFVDYCERRAQRAKSQIYVAMKVNAMLDHVPDETCEKIPLANAIWLSRFVVRVSPKQLTETMIGKAQSMKEKEFADYINDKLPGAAKEEIKQSIIFSGCEKSLAKVVDEAVKVALWEIGLDDSPNDDKRNALERMAIFYLDSKCEHEGFKNLSNREAYLKAHKRKAN